MQAIKRITSVFVSLSIAISLIGCSASSNYGAKQTSNKTPSSQYEKNSDNSATEKLNHEKVESGKAEKAKLSDIPAYDGKPYTVINNNIPNFEENELKDFGYENYYPLDNLGRCTFVIASCGKDTMPSEGETRGNISSIKPSGWSQAKYDEIPGGWLWNRCHLIGWQLSAENANKKNLITGTKYLNTEGMLPFENMVADYIKETNNHVAYRVTPIFDGDNLVCSGVQIEAYSVEDSGKGIQFNVYCYNVQPGINIDYATGGSSSQTPEKETPQQANPPEASNNTQSNPQNTTQTVWIPKTGKKYHSSPSCSGMKNSTEVTVNEAINRGYEPCKKCY